MRDEALVELALEVSEAPRGDRELSAKVWLAFAEPDYRFPAKVTGRTPDSYQEAAGRFRHDGFGGEIPWPNFTRSADIYLLGDKEVPVPEGWGVRLSRWGRPNTPLRAWQASYEFIPQAPFKPADFLSVHATGADAALALCSAWLLMHAHQRARDAKARELFEAEQRAKGAYPIRLEGGPNNGEVRWYKGGDQFEVMEKMPLPRAPRETHPEHLPRDLGVRRGWYALAEQRYESGRVVEPVVYVWTGWR